ncbi:hypothetical protein NQ318_002866 [Aromia moschata]|uniref:Retrotransposon gag domain-containing protein n=1 Tax=Aromia moschata TaxID=1265417 RepID=A0AAV8Y792_9CUCU|nr:hypothetical protein NQ318_002866 [Aromia moschata]
MVTSLVVSLRGQALDILQSIPEEQQNDYDRIVGALELRYGHKYLRHVYQSQIKSRQQTTNESLQEYKANIERLVHLAYPQAPKEFLEQIGIQTFIYGLLDTEMQQALRLGRHTTISDVLVAALEFKTAKEASRNYKHKRTSKFPKDRRTSSLQNWMEMVKVGLDWNSNWNDVLLVARSLVQMNNQIPVRIGNISDKKIILKKNEVLGRCEPVEKTVKCEEVNQAQTNLARGLGQIGASVLAVMSKFPGSTDLLARS